MFSFKWKGQEKSKHSSTFFPLLALHPFISWVSFVSTLWHTPQNLISNNMINNTNLFSEPIWKCSEKSNYGVMEITFLQWILVSSTNKWVQNYLSHRVIEQSYRLPTALVKTLGIFPGILPFLSLFTYLKTASAVDSMPWKALEFILPTPSPPILSLDLHHFTGITVYLYPISSPVNFNLIMLMENGFQHQVHQIDTWDSLGSCIFTFQCVLDAFDCQVDSFN